MLLSAVFATAADSAFHRTAGVHTAALFASLIAGVPAAMRQYECSAK